ncbi:MAG TPA: ribosome-binding factor A [Candidatus Azoamicus sp.]
MKNFIKFKRYNKLIHKHIADIIIKDYSRNNIITITSVHINLDFTFIKVFISSFKDTDYIIKLLNMSSNKIKHMLSCKIKTFKIPNLIFVNDSKNKIF